MALRIKKKINVFGEIVEYDCYTNVGRIDGEKTFLQFEVADRRFSDQENVIQYIKYNFIPSVADGSPGVLMKSKVWSPPLVEN